MVGVAQPSVTPAEVLIDSPQGGEHQREGSWMGWVEMVGGRGQKGGGGNNKGAVIFAKRSLVTCTAQEGEGDGGGRNKRLLGHIESYSGRTNVTGDASTSLLR